MARRAAERSLQIHLAERWRDGGARAHARVCSRAHPPAAATGPSPGVAASRSVAAGVSPSGHDGGGSGCGVARFAVPDIALPVVALCAIGVVDRRSARHHASRPTARA
jgi:hypothetical protein